MATAVLRHTVVIWPLSTSDRDKLKRKLILFVAEAFAGLSFASPGKGKDYQRDHDKEDAGSGYA